VLVDVRFLGRLCGLGRVGRQASGQPCRRCSAALQRRFSLICLHRPACPTCTACVLQLEKYEVVPNHISEKIVSDQKEAKANA
jgi:hypothetical protein